MRAIRSMPQLPHAADHRGDRQGDEGRPREVLEAGAWDYLAKPVEADQLLAVLRGWLRR